MKFWLAMVLSLATHFASAQMIHPPPSNARTIGVVVLAGEELRLTQIGPLVFWNAYGKVRTPDDRLADTLFDRIKAQLDAEQRAKAVRVHVDPGQRSRLIAKAFEGSNRLLGPSLSVLSGELRQMGERCECDALLVVAEMRHEIYPTNQHANGLNWVAMGRSGLISALAFYLIDARTGEVQVVRGAGHHMATVAADWPVKPDKTETLPETTWVAVGEALRIGLDGALREPLYCMGLRPSCARHFYEFHTSERQREPTNPDFVMPPQVFPDVDLARCWQGPK